MLRFIGGNHFLTEDYIAHSPVEGFTPEQSGSVTREIVWVGALNLDHTDLGKELLLHESLGAGCAGLGNR